MGNLNETAIWVDGVPYFAADAVLTGGPDCPDNIPIQALTNRTAFLKKQIDDAVSGALVTMTAKKLQTARTITMTGDGAWSTVFDGSGNVSSAMTLKSSIALTGTPTAPTAAQGNNSQQIANTAFVQAAIAALVASSPAALDTLQELAAALGNDASFATTMTNALAQKAPLASPAFSGIPTAPTAAAGTNSQQIANTAYVQAAIAALVASSPAALDTLQELAAALGNDANFATTMTNALAGKAAKATTLAGYGITDGLSLSAFTGANQSLASNGYQKMPGGLILQWGTSTAFTQNSTEDSYTITLPITFPNGILHAMAGNAGAVSFDAVPSISAMTTSQLTIAKNIMGGASSFSGTLQARWFAIGY